MDQLKVVLTPITKKVGTQNRVGGVKINIVASGKKVSVVGSKPQPAKLELIEVPKGIDAVTVERVLYALEGTIKSDASSGKEVPQFDAVGKAGKFLVAAPDTDFGVALEFDDGTFTVSKSAGRWLPLPWQSEVDEDKQMEVRARLTVGAEIEADIARNDSFDIPMTHSAVPDEGKNTADTSDYFGVVTVYSKTPAKDAPKLPIPFKGKTLNIYIEKNIGEDTAGYDFKQVTAALTKIFTDVGLTPIKVHEIKYEDTDAQKIWTLRKGEVIAQNVSDPEGKIQPKEGVDIPFFDFWCFTRQFGDPPEDEVAHSEALNPNNQVSVAAVTKRIVAPIMFYTKKGKPYQNVIKKLLNKDDANDFLATVVAHEIGHTLGLRHPLKFDASTGKYGLAPRCGVMAQAGPDDAGRFAARLFGPMHKAYIQKNLPP